MDPRVVSKENARSFLVSRQCFRKWKGRSGALSAVRQLECVQIDPIQVVHRNHHLVIHSRVCDYAPTHLDKLLYKDRTLFEYWCNGKSIIPIEDFPYFRYRMQNPDEFHSPYFERIKARRKEFEREISRITSSIKREGPLCAQDFERERKGQRKVATKILNLLWDCGDLMIHHIEGNRRYFDLTKRVLGSKARTKSISQHEYNRFMIEKYIRAYGLIDTRDWRFGWLPMKASERRAAIERMTREGEVHPLKVEGVKHIYYVSEDDLAALDKRSSDQEGIHLIAPLDNLIWNRRMVSEVFDFKYTWEVYRIPEKRIYGYYVMPILHGTTFIGRLDPKLDRKNKKMVINSIALERKRVEAVPIMELVEELSRFARFHGVDEVDIIGTKPKKLKKELTRELSKLA